MNRVIIRNGVVSLCLVVLGACGSGGPELSPLAVEGREIARSSGCSACHGTDGQGGVGPAWVGLEGSEVTLEDGTIVTADAAYLRRSIQDPAAQIVTGYTTKMPVNTLTTEQIDAVIAYIGELAS